MAVETTCILQITFAVYMLTSFLCRFRGLLFGQVIGISMGTNCAPLLADLFLYSYENEFLDNMIRGGHRRLARSIESML